MTVYCDLCQYIQWLYSVYCDSRLSVLNNGHVLLSSWALWWRGEELGGADSGGDGGGDDGGDGDDNYDDNDDGDGNDDYHKDDGCDHKYDDFN